MIFVTGFGQMSNNILQFGHLYAWGKERGLSVIALRFCYKYPFFTISKSRYYNWFTYVFAKYSAKLGLVRKISFLSEKDVNPEKLKTLQTARNTFVEGWYLRDYEAFLRHRNDIKNLFSFNQEIISAVNSKLPQKSKNEIRLGVHIRRGDYTKWKGGKFYYSDEDFIHIIQSFTHLFPEKNTEIVIVSNDRNINKSEFSQTINESSIHFLSGNSGEDLYALSTCDYLIGPPSTFSLMASFYNDASLYWIFDKKEKLTTNSFKKFDYLFRHII